LYVYTNIAIDYPSDDGVKIIELVSGSGIIAEARLVEGKCDGLEDRPSVQWCFDGLKLFSTGRWALVMAIL
jgi:hypothetical protein